MREPYTGAWLVLHAHDIQEAKEMVVWWLWLLIGFIGGLLFTAGIVSAVCFYGWRNKEKMAQGMLRYMIKNSHANS
jgi:hypothetical protein